MFFMGFLPMVNFSLPTLTNKFLRGFIPLDYILPNVFENSIDESSYDSRTFIRNIVPDMNYSLFLVNAYKLMYVFFFLLLIWIISYFGVVCKSKTFGRLAFKILHLFRFRIILRFFMIEYVEIGIYSILQIIYFGTEGSIFLINTIVGYIWIILFLAFTIFMFIFINVNKSFILDEQIGTEFHSKYGIFSEDINKKSTKPRIFVHHLVDILRKLFFIAGAYAYDFFFVQFSLIVFSSLAYVCWIFYMRPFYTLKINLFSVITEFVFLIVVLLGFFVNSQNLIIRYLFI